MTWNFDTLTPNSARWSVDARAESASAEGLLPVHGLQSEMPDLHQPAGGDGAISPAAGRVRHHPHDLWTPSGGRVYSQGLLGEAKHVRVRITGVGSQIWPCSYFWWSSKVALYNKFFQQRCLFSFTGQPRPRSDMTKLRFTVWIRQRGAEICCWVKLILQFWNPSQTFLGLNASSGNFNSFK